MSNELTTTENRLSQLFKQKEKIKSIYFTAGYPTLDDTEKIILLLQKYRADMIEIGFPFSDPLMDGPAIQQANAHALENGMSLEILFQQLRNIKDKINVPLILMGSMNPVYQYGFEKFCKSCAAIGIQGTIIPEMMVKEYTQHYKALYMEHGLSNIFMITPQTSEERIRAIDETSNGFIYMISSNSTTGNKKSIYESEEYFKKVQAMKLKNAVMTGFNINDKGDVDFACRYSQGVVIGSAFIKLLSEGVEEDSIRMFMEQIQ